MGLLRSTTNHTTPHTPKHTFCLTYPKYPTRQSSLVVAGSHASRVTGEGNLSGRRERENPHVVIIVDLADAHAGGVDEVPDVYLEVQAIIACAALAAVVMATCARTAVENVDAQSLRILPSTMLPPPALRMPPAQTSPLPMPHTAVHADSAHVVHAAARAITADARAAHADAAHVDAARAVHAAAAHTLAAAAGATMPWSRKMHFSPPKAGHQTNASLRSMSAAGAVTRDCGEAMPFHGLAALAFLGCRHTPHPHEGGDAAPEPVRNMEMIQLRPHRT